MRANYENLTKGISKTNEYLVIFLENLLLGGTNSLKSRDLHITKLNTDTVNDTVLELLTLNNKITTKEIAEKLGIRIATVKRRIKALKEAGSIERVGSDKIGCWKIL